MVLDLIASVSFLTVGGMAVLAGVMGAFVGFLHRTYMRQRVPFYAPIIVGLGAIGLWLNGSAALIAFVANMGGETAEPLVISRIETNTLAALVGTFAAYGGGRVGDVLAPNVHALVGAKTVDREVSKLVRTVGRFITVTIPERVEDIDGYEPVSAETKTTLAGTELVFPRGLTVDELRDRIATRLREDHGVGHVDVELTRDGEVEHFAVGSRAAGIGPTLPPRRVAIGLTANPAPKASPGDRVQIWEPPGETPEGSTEGPADAAAVGAEVPDEPPGTGDLPAVFAAHPERWYRPDSERHAFAVRTPAGGRRYAETAAAAAALLERYYGEGAGEPAEHDETPPTEESVAGPRRVATGELRATNGDIATLVIDVGRLDEVDQSKSYRMVTLQTEGDSDREFAALLRAANETMDSVTVAGSSGLDGLPVGALTPTVAAIRPAGGSIETIPPRDRVLEGGDVVYAIGRPDELRKLQSLSSLETPGSAADRGAREGPDVRRPRGPVSVVARRARKLLR